MTFDWHTPGSKSPPSLEPHEQPSATPVKDHTGETISAALAPPRPLPAIYLGHGAPMLLDDQEWVGQLGAWASEMPRP